MARPAVSPKDKAHQQVRAALEELVEKRWPEMGPRWDAEVVMSVENEKSRRVAEKMDAHYEGILLNRMVVGKAIYDAHMYSLLPSDFGLVAQL